MDSQAAETQQASRCPKSRGHKALWLVAVVGAVLLGAVHVLHRSTPEDRSLKWLTPAEIVRANRAGPITQLEWKLLRVIGPLGNIFRSQTINIGLDVTYISLASEWARQFTPAGFAATNIDRVSAWILTKDEVADCIRRLQTSQSPASVSECRIITGDGGQARLYQGGARVIGGTNIPIGLTIDVLPKIETGSLKLVLAATSIDAVESRHQGSPEVRTNLAAACQSFIPNDGALMLARTDPEEGRAYWLIIRAAAVDAKGKPRKL